MISTDPQRVKAAQINVVVVTCFCPVGDVGSGGPFTENPTLLICSRYLVALTGEVPVTMCLVGTSALGRASGRGWFGLTVRAGRGLGRGCEECGATCAEGGPRGGGGRGTEAAGVCTCDAPRPESETGARAVRSRAEAERGLL